MKDKYKNNKKLVLCLVIIMTLGLLYAIYKCFDISNKYDLIIYKDNNDELCEKESNQEVTEAFRIKVSSKKAKVLDIDITKKLFVLYDDNGLYIYDVNNKTKQSINLLNKYELYKLALNDDENRIIGIICSNDNGEFYYDVLNNKTIEIKVDDVDSVSIKKISDKYLSLRGKKDDSSYSYLFNIETGKVDLNNEFIFANEKIIEYELLKYNNQYIIVLQEYNESTAYYDYLQFFNMNLELFYDSGDTVIDNSEVSFEDGKLTIKRNGLIEIYDINGNLLSSINDK